MKMPCGKFKGKEIEDIPSAYLHWLAENSKDDKIATAADQEWRHRDQFNEHWKHE